jgi:hypothetical protein
MKRMASRELGLQGTTLSIGIGFVSVFLFHDQAWAVGPAAIDLGSIAPFTVFATATTTTTGGGIINGDVGLYPAGSQGIPQDQINTNTATSPIPQCFYQAFLTFP